VYRASRWSAISLIGKSSWKRFARPHNANAGRPLLVSRISKRHSKTEFVPLLDTPRKLRIL
jgi:hypothetical protein